MDETKQTPRTVGELRRWLAEHGNPWTVDPRLGNDDPLPNPPRGGQNEEDIPQEHRLTAVAPDVDLRELLRTMLPANPSLQVRWVELGLITPPEASSETNGG